MAAEFVQDLPNNALEIDIRWLQPVFGHLCQDAGLTTDPFHAKLFKFVRFIDPTLLFVRFLPQFNEKCGDFFRRVNTKFSECFLSWIFYVRHSRQIHYTVGTRYTVLLRKK